MTVKRRLIFGAITIPALIYAVAFYLGSGYSRIHKGMRAEQVVQIVGPPTCWPITARDYENHRWAAIDGEFCIVFRQGVVDSKQYFVWESRQAALQNWWREKQRK